MKKILIGSPIKQKPKILQEFLTSLTELDKGGFEYYFYFIDDNTSQESKEILKKFKNNNKNVEIKTSTDFFKHNPEYEKNEAKHIWKKELIERIISFKNNIILFAQQNKFDYLFFVDSDIVLNPKTIIHLAKRNVDIVSCVFWTSWKENQKILPQVWLQDESNSYIENWDQPLTPEVKKQKTENFIQKLKIPGIYRVGGLGACTLLSEKSINSGVNFSLIDNISFWGEDRHFCIRARVLGLDLFVDTVYPAYHIYRDSDLSGVDNFKKNGFNPNLIQSKYSLKKTRFLYTEKILSVFTLSLNSLKAKYKKIKRALVFNKRIVNDKNYLTVSMIVYNEEKKFLKETLEAAKKYADAFVIIDDASTDGTVELCKKILKNTKHKIIVNEKNMFATEYKLRKKQWEETVKTKPDWILFLDADEILELRFNKIVKNLMSNKDVDLYSFRVFDMWNETQYRQDEIWRNDVYHRFLLRYQPNFKYKFQKRTQHCGRMPSNVVYLPYSEIDIKVKHLGWASEKIREEKYERYQKLDSNKKPEYTEQYDSILDKNPALYNFIEDENFEN